MITKLGEMQRGHVRAPPLPTRFSSNSPSFFFIQKMDGTVDIGYLQKNGRAIPDWANFWEYDENEATQHGVVRMRNGVSYISSVQHLPIAFGYNVNDQLPEDVRCFILYDQVKILVADLKIMNQMNQQILVRSDIIVQVRMRDAPHDRYVGEFEHYNGPHLSWLREYVISG